MAARWSTAGVVIAFCLALAGCGGEASAPEGAAQPDERVFTLFDEPLGVPWTVREIRHTADPNSLDLVVADVPVADGRPGCDASTEVREGTRSDGAVRLHVEVLTRASRPHRDQLACAAHDVVHRVVLGEPLLAADTVVVLSPSDPNPRTLVFYPGDGDVMRLCELPLCDPATGGPAPEPGCDTIVRDIREGYLQLDLPRRAGRNVVACDGHWAVIEIDFGAAACPAGQAPGTCPGRNLDRAYLRLLASGFWTADVWDDTAGCGRVPDLVPEFPRELCEDLAPLR